MYYNTKLTQKQNPGLKSPPTTASSETEWVYSGRSSQISQEVNE